MAQAPTAELEQLHRAPPCRFDGRRLFWRDRGCQPVCDHPAWRGRPCLQSVATKPDQATGQPCYPKAPFPDRLTR